MRIVTWNCYRGPSAKKLAALDALRSDLAILSEAPALAVETEHALWFPAEGSSLGTQVRTSGAYGLERLPRAALPSCVNPVRVTGPVSFNLLAVWTWPAPTYVKALANALAAYATLLECGPTVVAGDFNGSPVHDKPRTWVKWADSFGRLDRAGLVSAYHHVNRVNFGKEPHATHHFLRKASRPFHIDFCFVPRAWAERGLSAHIESSAEWASLSDHFPLVVEVSPHLERISATALAQAPPIGLSDPSSR
jgi:hypothetical protein